MYVCSIYWACGKSIHSAGNIINSSIFNDTGAIYCDTSLRTRGFNGEGMTSGSLIAVKVHHFEYESDTVNWADLQKPGVRYFTSASMQNYMHLLFWMLN